MCTAHDAISDALDSPCARRWCRLQSFFSRLNVACSISSSTADTFNLHVITSSRCHARQHKTENPAGVLDCDEHTCESRENLCPESISRLAPANRQSVQHRLHPSEPVGQTSSRMSAPKKQMERNGPHVCACCSCGQGCC